MSMQPLPIITELFDMDALMIALLMIAVIFANIVSVPEQRMFLFRVKWSNVDWIRVAILATAVAIVIYFWYSLYHWLFTN